MTVHACLCRRDASKAGGLHRGVTISAINSKSSHMVLMAERHGLCAHDLALRVITGALHHFEKPERRENEQHSTDQSEPKHGIRARLKNLSHGWKVLGGSAPYLARTFVSWKHTKVACMVCAFLAVATAG